MYNEMQAQDAHMQERCVRNGEERGERRAKQNKRKKKRTESAESKRHRERLEVVSELLTFEIYT